MNVENRYQAMNQTLETKITVTARELEQMADGVQAHLTRRIVDGLFAELMPKMRAAILESLSPEYLATIVTGELSLAIKGAFRNDQS